MVSHTKQINLLRESTRERKKINVKSRKKNIRPEPRRPKNRGPKDRPEARALKITNTPKQLMSVHDAEHGFKNSIFKVYAKYLFRFFLTIKFLRDRWSVSWWSKRLVGGRLVGP